MPEFFKIWNNPRPNHVETAKGPHPDAAHEIELRPVGDKGIAEVLDTGKRGLSTQGLAALNGLNLNEDAPPTDAEMSKLMAISKAAGCDPNYMPPEVIDSAYRGLPDIGLEDVDPDGDAWYHKNIFPKATETQRGRMNEHMRAIQKHITADRNASWRDDSCGGF